MIPAVRRRADRTGRSTTMPGSEAREVQVFGVEDEGTGNAVLPGFRCPVGRLFP